MICGEMEASPSEPVDKKPLIGADGTIIPSPGNPASVTAADQTSPTEIIGGGGGGGGGEISNTGSATPVPTISSSETNLATTTTTTIATTTNPTTTTVSQLDIEILPTIYEIIRSVEKDHLDTTAKQRESAECGHKILELQKRFESAREQIKQLPGIDFNKEEQLQKLEQLGNQYKLKKQLLIKYRDNKF